jgi:hypothetical protein
MLKTVKMQFTVGVYEFTKENISKFITPVFARSINKNHVKRLKDFLVSNDYQFGSAITVVKTGSGKYLCIDGNHRIQAFREILKNQIDSVHSVVIEYPSMSIDNMKEFMRVLGLIVKRQNLDSLFEIYEKDILIYQNIHKIPLKVSIRNKKGFFRLINLINFLEVKDSKRMPLQISAERTLERARQTDEKDIEWVKQFLSFFVDVFGKISEENRYAVPCFMIPLASVYGVNYESIIKDLDNSKRRFQNLIQDPEILELLAIGGKARQLIHAVRNRQIRVLNRKVLKNSILFE